LEIINIDKNKLSDTLRIWDSSYNIKHRARYLHKFLLLQEVDRNSYETYRFSYNIIGPKTWSFKEPSERDKFLKKIDTELFKTDLNQDYNIPKYELSYLIIGDWERQFITEELDYPLLYDSDGIQIYQFEEK
ncbi:hypothetical protein KAS50_10090, partial [bacterium]|nr:hypothetical protein [bacterium]